MADQELDVQQAASGNGASQEVAKPEGASQEPRQPEATQAGGLPDDWTKDERFRKYQSEQDRKFEQLRNQLSQHQQQMEQQRMEAERRAMENMSDEERWQYTLQREQQARANAERQLQAYQAEIQRTKVLAELSQKTGAPITGYLDQAEDWQSAQDLAIEYMKKSQREEVTKGVQKQQQRSAANAVDVGGSSSLTGEWDARRETYLRNKDSIGYFKDLITNKD